MERAGLVREVQHRLLLLFASLILGSAVTLAADSNRAPATTEQWLTGGHDNYQTFYSPLARIDATNVSQLGFAWSYDLDTEDGLEATPVVVDGVMYASAPRGAVHALDARTGRGLWSFHPEIDTSVMRKVCCGIVNRGLSVAEGKVFVAGLDGRLYALDASTGEVVWDVDTIVDHARGYTVTGSTYVAGKVVVIGNSGAEFDARGYVSAYDLSSGELVWRFYTVPASTGGPFEHPELEMAARTWDPNSRFDVGLGGTVWDGMAYDPELGLIYIGVGNSALYPRKLRSPTGGDNLFVASVVALNASTGRMAWYYQTTPGDQWDYTATQKMILAELEIRGRQREVLLQAPKNGFFYVLDRATGELLSAEPYVPVNWASHIDKQSGKPVETGLADYSDQPRLVFPSPAGGHNWHPMAFNPETGLVYIPVLEASAVFWLPDGDFQYKKGAPNTGSLYAFPARNAGAWGLESEAARDLPPLKELAKGHFDTTQRGYLRAWDPVTQRTVWQVETSGQWVGEMNALWNGGGVMTTAGNLVFQGRSTGYLHMYAADSGRELASLNVGTGIMAAPMTYKLDDAQYVAVMAGFGGALGGTRPEGTAAYRYGNAGRIVAFKLGGGEVPLPPEVRREADRWRPAVERFGSGAEIARGGLLLKRYCSRCHANEAGGTVPDLRHMTRKTHGEFDAIVLDGVRSANGMGAFGDFLGREDTRAIRAAIVDSAWDAYEERLIREQPTVGPHTPATD